MKPHALSFLCCLIISTASAAAEDLPVSRLLDQHPALDLALLSPGAVKKLNTLKPGVTRKQLATFFAHDRGLIFLPVERFYLRNVSIPDQPRMLVMVEIVLKPAGMDARVFADPERSAAAWPARDSPRDVVVEVGKPYLSGLAWVRPPRG